MAKYKFIQEYSTFKVGDIIEGKKAKQEDGTYIVISSTGRAIPLVYLEEVPVKWYITLLAGLIIVGVVFVIVSLLSKYKII